MPARQNFGWANLETETVSMESRVNQLVHPAIRAQPAYQVPSSAGLIKLDAMENPYPLPLGLQEQWKDCLASAHVNRYPDPGADALRRRIRQVFSVPRACDLLLGNGSDELIQMLALLVGGPDRVFLAPDPSFSMYRMISQWTGTPFQGVSLQPDFSLDADSLFQQMHATQPACIFLAYPNNPTGNRFNEDLMRAIFREAPGLVVVDEAYFAFCGHTFLNEVPDHPNLLVLRTLSKSGLAGLRLGMVMGSPDWIGELDKVRLPYNINSLSQVGARFCLDHYEVLTQQAEWICVSREHMIRELRSISGVTVYPSEANFVLVRLSAGAEHMFARLKKRGILVKNLHQSGGLLENCLRITVGTVEENSALLDRLRKILN